MGTQNKTFRQNKRGRLQPDKTGLSEKLIATSTIAVMPRSSFSKAVDPALLKTINFRKRLLDIGFSMAALVLLLPVLPVFIVLIKCSSSGPVLFKQLREGKDGIPFVCYKFRSMHIQKKKRLKNGLPRITQREDERIFTFGQFMRRNNLDELPQLLNVIKGDMSLTGPRPYMVSECEYWEDIFDDFEMREQIKPGMSGLAQVNGYRGGSLCKKHMRTRLDYDLIYVKSYNMWIDVKIIGRTILQMLRLNTRAL